MNRTNASGTGLELLATSVLGGAILGWAYTVGIMLSLFRVPSSQDLHEWRQWTPFGATFPAIGAGLGAIVGLIGGFLILAVDKKSSVQRIAVAVLMMIPLAGAIGVGSGRSAMLGMACAILLFVATYAGVSKWIVVRDP